MPDPKAISRIKRRRARDIKKETCIQFLKAFVICPRSPQPGKVCLCDNDSSAFHLWAGK